MEFQSDFAGALRKLSPETVGRVFRPMKDELHAWAIEEEGDFRSRRLNGRPGLNRWSGNLARSFVPIWEQSPASTRAGMMFLPKIQGPDGEMDNYANIHETGGDIVPKHGRMLAWPVRRGPAQTQGGRNRFSGPRSYPGKLFVHRTADGKFFLAESVGRGKAAKLRMVYHLASRVTIPPRLGFRLFALPALRRAERRLREAQEKAVASIGGAA